jgi:hypothetical protein
MRPHYALRTSLNVLNFGASSKGIYASDLRILNIRQLVVPTFFSS